MARKKKLSPEMAARLEELKSLLRPSNLANYREVAAKLSHPDQLALMKVFFNESSGITREIWYEMIPFFQQNPEIWAQLRKEVPFHIHSAVEEWLPRKILNFQGSKEDFCRFATENVREFYPDFPDLTLKIISEERTGYYYGCDLGEKIEDGIGWKLKMEGMLFGPAETRSRETWEAIAIHPEGNLKVALFAESSPKHYVWLEELGNSSAF